MLHDEVREAVVGGAAVEQPRDVWMLQPRQDLALAAEVPDDLRAVQAADHLDGHALLVLVVGAGGEVHRAHPTVAERAQQAVGPDPPLRSSVLRRLLDGRCLGIG
jgi:hypothetical protein